MKYFFYILFNFVLFSSVAYSQHEADYWYFGNYAGLDFSSGKPEPLTDGQLQNYEGCAVASDSAGNLLFYTNGVTVWNKEHQIMENGEGLMGDSSSTQSAIVIPQPNNDSLFYVFTTDELTMFNQEIISHDGLRYSIININEFNNLGKIIIKNELLIDSALEKVTAVKHYNNKDYWIITHEWRNNKFYTWLLNENGISAMPITSNVGSSYESVSNSVGYMKISPTSEKLVVAKIWPNTYELFNFDNSTGLITEDFAINYGTYDIPYGCEFSPDGSKLYFTVSLKLFQANMNAGTPTDIINSITEIYDFDLQIGALQLAKNGKLYITTDGSDYLSVIHYPDSLPATCGFEKNAVYLEGRKARLGLPNFIQSYFKKPDFKYENTCVFDETQFFIEDLTNVDSVEWDFGEPESGSLNFSTELSPTHKYSNSGIFKVILTVWFNNVSTVYSENIKIVPLPELNLGNDTTFCIAENYNLNAYSQHATYLWNDLSTIQYLNIDTTGKYWVDVENIYTGCKNNDTINIVFSEIPDIDLGEDNEFCENSSYFLNAYHENYTYTWQDLSEEPYFTVYEPGIYYVKVANSDDCANIDSITLSLKYLPRFNFPEDTILCEGTEFILSPLLENDVTFKWQDGSTEDSFFVTDSGFYKLVTRNYCGSWSDNINIDFLYCGDIYIPNIFTPTNDGINELFHIKGIEYDTWNLDIYNRWGQLVNRYKDYKNNWDGKDIFGRKLAETVYYYILTNPNTAEVYKGTVRIVR